MEQVDLGRLGRQGYRGILLDIDNTLGPWLAQQPDAMAARWVRRAKAAGFRVCLVSNARGRRVRSYAKILDVPMVLAGHKPGKRPFLAAARQLQLPVDQLVVVGDQLLTDVWGAKRVGMGAVLVDPVSPREFIATRIGRWFERFILSQMARHHLIDPADLERRRRALRRRRPPRPL